MGGEADAKREAGMIKLMTRSNLRTRNDTSVAKKDIRSLISQRVKNMKTIITRAKGVAVVERA